MLRLLFSLFVRLRPCSLPGCCVPNYRAICRCWEYVLVVDLSVQARSNVTLEDVAVLDESRPTGHGFSLNFHVLVFVSVGVTLSQVEVHLK